MNIFISLIGLKMTICQMLFASEVDRVNLTAVNRSPYVLTLYKELRNEDPPSKTDPARLDGRIRESVCKNIVSSGFFGSHQWFDLLQVDNMYHIQDDPRHSAIFHKIYRFNRSRNFYEYTNLYEEREFSVLGLDDFKEHVFICPYIQWSLTDTRVFPLYISKEYDVAAQGEPYRPGRFVVVNFLGEDFAMSTNYLLLAEEPAIAYTETGFNVESYYLRIRKHVEPAKTNDIDPLCKLVSGALDDHLNQHYRLCVAVARSSYMRNKFKCSYPALRVHPCRMERIAFKTQLEAGHEDFEKMIVYYEQMTLCHTSIDSRQRDGVMYISRAYKSGEVFVYSLNHMDGKIYLQNLSTNVSVVDELNSFDFVEN